MIRFRSLPSLILAVTAILATAATSQAKENSSSQTKLLRAEIGQGVYHLDNLADQMSFKYSWELRYNRSCKDSLSLLRRLQRHAALTNDLVRAYRGKCETSFQKAADAVRESVVIIEDLQHRSRVSDSVSRLIAQSVPLASSIHANTSNFLPTLASNTRFSAYRYRSRS